MKPKREKLVPVGTIVWNIRGLSMPFGSMMEIIGAETEFKTADYVKGVLVEEIRHGHYYTVKVLDGPEEGEEISMMDDDEFTTSLKFSPFWDDHRAECDMDNFPY